MNATTSLPGDTSGALLKRTREEKGITLEEASRVTKIGKTYLSHIEEDRFDALPNPAYVKGFLRSYAGYLGISADEVVRLYDESLAPPPQEGESVAPAAKEKQQRQPLAYLVIGAVVVVAVMGYMIGQREEEPQSKPTGPVPVQQLPAVSPVQRPVSSARPAPAAEVPPLPTDQVSPAAPTAPKKSLFLRMKVNENTRLYIDIDGSVSQQYELNAGDLIEWKGDSYFSIDIDNAAAVEVEFNDRKLPALGPAGAPAHVVLRRDDAKETQNQGEH